MLDILLRVFLAVLTCVGLVQAVSWAAVRSASRCGTVLRIFPVGGEGKNTGKQMAAMYACLQWESNPSRQQFVLYDTGLDDQGIHDCETLAEGAGIAFVRRGELESFISGR